MHLLDRHVRRPIYESFYAGIASGAVTTLTQHISTPHMVDQNKIQ